MPFIEAHPTREDYWRSVILFGRNVASYKFALAKSLLELATGEPNFIRLKELAFPFSHYITEHLARMDKQATSAVAIRRLRDRIPVVKRRVRGA